MSKPPETIRILHTADWHLGREFLGRNLDSVHQIYFDWLVRTVQEQEVDLVLVAGDIYDRALPPVGAIDLFNRQLARLTEVAEVVLIAGNHDSVVRMSHGPLLMERLHLRSGIHRLGEPVLFERGFPLAIYPIPYLDPLTMGNELGLDVSSHESVLGEALRRCREDLDVRDGARSIAIGHAFITGATTSESERSIQVGGSESVNASIFEGFDYVALGHLHRPQKVGERIRYAGSPIPLSYSEVEAGASKSVVLLDLSANGDLEQNLVEVPQPVEMARIKGTLETLLESDEFEDVRDDWLEITLTDTIRPDQPMDRLRTRFQNVVSLRFDSPLSSADPNEAVKLAEIAEANPAKLVASFIEEVRGTAPVEAEADLIQNALDEKTGAETIA